MNVTTLSLNDTARIREANLFHCNYLVAEIAQNRVEIEVDFSFVVRVNEGFWQAHLTFEWEHYTSQVTFDSSIGLPHLAKSRALPKLGLHKIMLF